MKIVMDGLKTGTPARSKLLLSSQKRNHSTNGLIMIATSAKHIGKYSESLNNMNSISADSL